MAKKALHLEPAHLASLIEGTISRDSMAKHLGGLLAMAAMLQVYRPPMV